MKKYLVVIYDWEVGFDDRLDFDKKSDAIAHARDQLRHYDSAAVLNMVDRCIVATFRDFPVNCISF